MQRFERFSDRELDAYWGGARACTGKPSAPLRLHVEGTLLAVEATIQAVAGEEAAAAVCAIPVTLSIGKLRTELEQQRANELGLTAETAPQRMVGGWEWTMWALGWYAHLRVRSRKPAAPTWTLRFAHSLVREIDRRQAWRRALRASYKRDDHRPR